MDQTDASLRGDAWTPLIWLAAGLALLVPVTRWFARRVEGLATLATPDLQLAIYAMYVLFLPGTLVHELIDNFFETRTMCRWQKDSFIYRRQKSVLF